jgi:putative membrane protein insertion efficiency factor
MKKILLFLLKLYKKYISPMFKAVGIECKYYPSCSEYMRQAIEKYGAIKGTAKGLKRLIRCNPFSKGGYDPLK